MPWKSNAPPGREPSGANTESVVAAQLDNRDDRPDSDLLQGRYCGTLQYCLIADALLEKIERALICHEALHVDGFDLLQLHDDFLPLWLSDAPSIVASDILVGRTIRAAFAAEGIRPPPIYVCEPHDG
jgi:hypothetical protein